MARRRGSSKGTPFEREVCDMLSEWWCGNDEDRIFWRTSGSGATATVRKRKGKNTEGQHNDVCAIHHSGKPLTDLISMEIKKGYMGDTLQDLIDRPNKSVPKGIELFIDKARRGMRESGSFAWMVIHMRDKRKILVYFPYRLMTQLVEAGCFPKPACPFVTIDTIFRYEVGNKKVRVDKVVKGKKKRGYKTVKGKRKKIRELICVTTLAKFLERVTPDHIRHLARHLA
jgi:hypothetical protein